MNKQACDKIKFILWGTVGRIKENKDFINAITFKFKSGLKFYEGVYDIEENLINFNGKDEKLSVDELPEFLAIQSSNYDSLEFILQERGQATLILGDNKGVKTQQRDSANNPFEDHNSAASKILKRNYLIKIGEADDLLREIGILTKDGKIKNDMIRKYNQIDHFIELVDGMIDELPDVETINVIDCACGKSYLTFVLNYYIKEKKKKNCFFIGIDRSKTVIDASKKIASNLGYRNMEFLEADLNDYTPDRRIDIMISLHACDIATDMALGLALRLNAKAIMCVPCCHKELLGQYSFPIMDPICKHGIFKARFADILTDGVRGLLLETQGYKVSITEYISPLETPKNLLIRAVKNSDKNIRAIEEYKHLKDTFNIYPYLERYINL